MPSSLHILARDLVLLLQHTAPLHGLEMRQDGFVKVDDILRLPQFESATTPDLDAIVAARPMLLELLEARDKRQMHPTLYIRARCGHSIQNLAADVVELEAHTCPQTLVYRTNLVSWAHISSQGLRSAPGQFLGFELGQTTDMSTLPVSIHVDVVQAMTAGIPFYLTYDGRILSPGDAVGAIAATFFSRVEVFGSTGAQSLRDTDNPYPSPKKAPKGRRRRRKPSTSASVAAQAQGTTSLSLPQEYFSRMDAGRSLGSVATVPQADLHPVQTALSHLSLHAGACDMHGAELPAQSPVARARTSAAAAARLHDDVAPSTVSPSQPSENSDDSGLSHFAFSDSESEGQSYTSNEQVSTPRSPSSLKALRGRSTLEIPIGLSLPNGSRGTTGKWLIMPVAIPGCGRTSLVSALAHLFDIGHVKSGDAKESRSQFLRNVKAELRAKDVVIADRNNHLRTHRRRLLDVVDASNAPTKVLALRWTLQSPSAAAVHRQCASRVLSWKRGHPWFKARKGATLDDMLWGFLSDAEPVEEDEADAIIDMDPFEDLEAALARAVDGFLQVTHLPRPSVARIADALRVVRESCV